MRLIQYQINLNMTYIRGQINLMCDFLELTYRPYLTSHKNAIINFDEQNKAIMVNYDKKHQKTSAGIRSELFLEPNTSYQIEIEATLIQGDPAFVYVESGNTRLVPRFKIHQSNNSSYQLKHNFITPSSDDVNRISTWVGILFYHPDQNYHLEIKKFVIKKLNKLTTANLNKIPNQLAINLPLEQSILESTNHQLSNTNYTYLTVDRPQSQQLPKSNNNISRVNDQETISNYSFPSQISTVTHPAPGLQLLGPNTFQPKTDDSSSTIYQQSNTRSETNLKNDLLDNWDNSTYYSRQGIEKSRRNRIKNEEIRDILEVQDRFEQQIRQEQKMEELKLQERRDKIMKQRLREHYNNQLSNQNNIDNIYSNNQLLNQNNINDYPDLDTRQWIPQNPSDDIIYMLKERMKQQKNKIVISLTTTPSRIGKVEKVVKTLLNQSLPISQVYLVIPQRYKRTNKPYMISKKWYFKSDKRVKLVRSPDIGPMSKLHPILDIVSRNHIILTADDDHFYPKHWAFYLSYLAIMHPEFKATYGFNGYLNDKLEKSYQQEKPLNVNYFLSHMGVAYPRKWIKGESLLLKQVGYSRDAFYTDDILISNHLGRHKVARLLVPAVSILLANQVYPKEAPWSNDRKSLHKMNPGRKIRYQLVCNVLKSKRNYNLNNLGNIMKKNDSVLSQMNSNLFANDQNNNSNEPENQGPHVLDWDNLVSKQTNVDSNNQKSGLVSLDKLSQTNQINRELTARELEYQKHIRQMTQHNNNQNNQETTKDDHQNNQLEQFKLERSLISLPMKIKNQKQGKSLFSRLDPSYFDDKKVRYISYLNSIYHSEWVLLYLKKLSNASLEMPNLHYSVSLPPVYAPWFQNDVTNYDCIVVDLPFCLDSKVSIKTNKPIFFIYRYPTIGQPKLLLKKKNQDKGKLNPSINLVINSNMASHLSNQEKQIRVWRVLPELEIKNIATPLNPKQIHMALIITDAYYTANLDNLLNL